MSRYAFWMPQPLRVPGMHLALASTALWLAAAAAEAQIALAPMPAADAPLSRIAFGSCADEELPQPIWETIAAEAPELFLFLGDNVYADIHKGEWIEPMTVAALETAYADLARVAPFTRFAARVPILATWDDHDYGLNDAGREFPLKAPSKRLMLDFFGVPEDAPVRVRPGVYRARIFGPPDRRVQIILLDTRWFRSALKPTDERGAPGKERYLPDDDPGKTMLGEAQWRWLEAQLEKPARLRLLVSSVQVIADGHGWERWGNLPAERARLYALLAETGAEGVVLLSGDRHRGALYRRDGILPYPLYELTSSSLNRPSDPEHSMDEYGPHQLGHMYAPENYGVVSVDWEGGVLDLALKGMKGQRVRGITIPLAEIGAE